MGYEGSFTNTVRHHVLAHIRETGSREFTPKNIVDRLDIIREKEKKPVYERLCEFVRRGEARRIETGRYEYIGGPQRQATKRDVIWRFIRARRTVTVADLQEVSGASKDYIRKYLRLLVRREVLRKNGKSKDCSWTLVKDAFRPPADREDAAYQKRMRKQRRLKKREAESALDAAEISASSMLAAIERARTALKELEV